MSKKAVTDSPRFQRAVKYINDNNTVKVPDAMRIVKYSEAQVADRSFQQRIRRAAANALGKKCSPNEIITDSESYSTMSTLTATPPKREYKTKSVRYNSKSAQQLRTNKKVTHRQFADALKYATSLYNEQKEKGIPTSGKKVSEFVEARLGVRVPPKTITDNVKNGRVNKSPMKRGPKGNFDEVSYQNLHNAFESYIKIKQINAGSADITRDKLMKLINQCTKPKIGCDCKWLLRRLLKDSAIDLIMCQKLLV